MVVNLLAYWKGQFGKHDSEVWKAITLCLIWCVWRERRMRTLFEVKVMSIDILIIKLLVFKVLRMDAGCFHNLEILDLLNLVGVYPCIRPIY